MLHFVRVEVGEEGVAAIFKTFYLLAHEFAGEIVDGLRGGEVGGNLEVQLVGIVMDEFLALREVGSEKEEILATNFLTDFFDDGNDEIPKYNGAQGLWAIHGCPEIVGSIVGTEMNQLDSGESLSDTGDALVEFLFKVFEDGAALLGESVQVGLGNAFAGA